jgi:hypothetical protein
MLFTAKKQLCVSTIVVGSPCGVGNDHLPWGVELMNDSLSWKFVKFVSGVALMQCLHYGQCSFFFFFFKFMILFFNFAIWKSWWLFPKKIENLVEFKLEKKIRPKYCQFLCPIFFFQTKLKITISNVDKLVTLWAPKRKIWQVEKNSPRNVANLGHFVSDEFFVYIKIIFYMWIERENSPIFFLKQWIGAKYHRTEIKWTNLNTMCLCQRQWEWWGGLLGMMGL